MSCKPVIVGDRVTHFSDPGCPWAWSNGPAFAVLQWRYGAQLQWRHAMIGLSETAEQYRRRGYTGESQALNYRKFRHRGMPFATEPRDRPHATWPMCRVVVATRRLAPDREWAVFRALQFAQFTSTLTLDEPDGHRAGAGLAAGHRRRARWSRPSTEPETEELFAADRALARSAAGGPTEFQDRSATTPEGEVRYTAPSLILEAEDGRSLEVGGFQPVEAYDVAIANLDRSLERRPPAEDAVEVLRGVPGRAHHRRGRRRDGAAPAAARPRGRRGRADRRGRRRRGPPPPVRQRRAVDAGRRRVRPSGGLDHGAPRQARDFALGGAGKPDPRLPGTASGSRRLVARMYQEAAPARIMLSAMTAMNYIETDLPEGMVLAEWRRAKAAARRKVRRTPRWRLRLA